MPFDIKNTNPAERFYYPDYATAMDMPEAQREWVELRLCIGEPLRQIEDETMEKRVEHVQPRKANGKINRRAAVQRIEYSDFKKDGEKIYQDKTTDFMFSNWQIFDTDGNRIDCTLENKKMMLKISDFDLFIGQRIESMMEDKIKLEGDRESNLSSTSKDSRKDQVVEPVEKPSQSTTTEKSPIVKTV